MWNAAGRLLYSDPGTLHQYMYIYISILNSHTGAYSEGGGADFWGQMPPPTLSKRKSKREKKVEKREKDKEKGRTDGKKEKY